MKSVYMCQKLGFAVKAGQISIDQIQIQQGKIPLDLRRKVGNNLSQQKMLHQLNDKFQSTRFVAYKSNHNNKEPKIEKKIEIELENENENENDKTK